MRPDPKTIFLAALMLAALTGLGVASAQLIPSNLPIGAPANEESTGEECESGVSINATLGMFCSDFCTENSDCPTGWGCRSVLQGDGSRAALCFPYRHLANP